MRTILRSFLMAALAALLAVPAFAAATIVIINTDGPGEGFNDATPAAPVGGNPGTTIGQQRLNCFQQAANIWGATLTSSVTINIQAAFNPLSCTATSAVLGSAGPITVSSSFPGAEFPGYWYHAALANKMAGSDLTAGNDINAQFNSNLGNVGCLTGSGWYYGFDHNEGALIDLLDVLLHEFGHGLGSSTTTSGTTGNQLGTAPGLPAIWDKYLFDETTNLHWEQMTPAQRVASAINTGKLVWDGGQVALQAPLFLAPATEVQTSFAPFKFEASSAAFGAAITAGGVSGNAVLVDDGVAATLTSDACETPFVNAAAVAGKIAVIDRGTCTFVVKAKNAQNNGAIGVILVNNTGGPLAPGGADPTITIPVVGISQADGAALKTAMLGGPVTVNLRLSPTQRAGMSTTGRVRMYSPNPFQSGSSVSHWDVTLTPNALMEPAINADLTDNLDLTIGQFKDIGWLTRDVPVATQAAVTDARVVNGHPHLEWFSADGAGETMRLYRRESDGDWELLGNVLADGLGKLAHDDMEALRGHTYDYELGASTPAGEKRIGFVSLAVPLKPALGLAAHRDERSQGRLVFDVQLPDDARASLELFDASGRRVAQQDLGLLSEGTHTVELAHTPPSGIYFVRLKQSGAVASARVVHMR